MNGIDQAAREAVQRGRLTFMRRVATGLLVAMAVLFMVAQVLEKRYPGLSYAAAFAEAAMIGALADWFAVTALFRHPLGLKIPHTAIIPSNKERIGENLGNFLEQNFMSVEVVQAELARFDFAGSAGHWLTRRETSSRPPTMPRRSRTGSSTLLKRSLTPRKATSG